MSSYFLLFPFPSSSSPPFFLPPPSSSSSSPRSAVLEDALSDLGARPHWGKVNPFTKWIYKWFRRRQQEGVYHGIWCCVYGNYVYGLPQSTWILTYVIRITTYWVFISNYFLQFDYGNGGKLFAHTPSQIKTIYGARLDRFKEVHSRVDPERKFTNAWLDRMVLDS